MSKLSVVLPAYNEELMIVTSEGIIIRIRVKDISTVGRIAQGVKLINVDDGVTVMSIAKISEDCVDEEINTEDTGSEDRNN